MNIMFWDTETTGLPPKGRAPLSAMPSIIQLAISVYDAKRRPIFEVSTLVKPAEGAVMAERAFEAHGIPLEQAIDCGVEMRTAMGLWNFARGIAVSHVCHNNKFDLDRLDELARRVQATPNVSNAYCTMTGMTPFTQLPPTERMKQFGHGDKFKAPTLLEAYKYLFNREFVGAHDALVDTRACADVYFEMVDRGWV